MIGPVLIKLLKAHLKCTSQSAVFAPEKDLCSSLPPPHDASVQLPPRCERCSADS